MAGMPSQNSSSSVHEIEKRSPVFWFMLQIAVLAGFLTAYPVNFWLLKAGTKEKM